MWRKGSPLCTLGGNVNWYSQYGKQYRSSSKKLKIELPYDLPTPLLGLYPKEMRGFLGGAVVKIPPANAGDMGLSPGLERSHMLQSNYAHAPQLLSLRCRAREPQLLSLCATTTEAHVPRARALQQEKPLQ